MDVYRSPSHNPSQQTNSSTQQTIAHELSSTFRHNFRLDSLSFGDLLHLMPLPLHRRLILKCLFPPRARALYVHKSLIGSEANARKRFVAISRREIFCLFFPCRLGGLCSIFFVSRIVARKEERNNKADCINLLASQWVKVNFQFVVRGLDQILSSNAHQSDSRIVKCEALKQVETVSKCARQVDVTALEEHKQWHTNEMDEKSTSSPRAIQSTSHKKYLCAWLKCFMSLWRWPLRNLLEPIIVFKTQSRDV